MNNLASLCKTIINYQLSIINCLWSGCNDLLEGCEEAIARWTLLPDQINIQLISAILERVLFCYTFLYHRFPPISPMSHKYPRL